jgi:hypothetical protein
MRPLAIVAADLVGTVAVLDRRDLRQRDAAVGRLDQDLAQALDRSRRFRQPHHQREAPAALDDLRDLLALDQGLQRRQHLRRRHAVLGGGCVVDAHLDLRRQHLLLDLQVGDARDGGQLRSQRIGLAPQRVEVLAEDLDRDLRAHARKHVVDAVRDGLADLQGGRQVHQPLADVGLDLVHAARELGGGLQAHVEFADVHALGVLVQLGPPTAPSDVRHFGHLLDQHFGLARQSRGFAQRDAGVQAQADQQRAFVEGRQEGRWEERHGGRGHQHGRARRRHGGLGPVQHALQAAAVARLEPGQHLGVAVVQVLHPRQQVEAEHGRHRHRDDQRGQRRDDERDAQRHEQLAFQPRQREQRDEDEHDDDRGVEDGRAHFHRGVCDDLDRMQPAVRVVRPICLQPPQHVLDTDHRVVDQTADGDGQAAQRHGVDRQAEVLEDQRGDEDRDREWPSAR